MKEININNNPIYLYLAKTLEFAESFRGTPYTREAPILFCTDKDGYYLGVQYDHNHIGMVSSDRYKNQHDVDLLIKCADKEYNIDDYIDVL